MKKSQLIQLVKEELRGWSPQVGQTKGLTPKTLNKILMKIASDDGYEPEGEVEERLKEALTQLKEEKPGLWANIRAKRARGEIWPLFQLYRIRSRSRFSDSERLRVIEHSKFERTVERKASCPFER